MMPQALVQTLKGKPLLVQSRWYRILAKAKIYNNRVTSSYLAEARQACRDYAMQREEEDLVRYLQEFSGTSWDLKREIEPLRDLVIHQGIVPKAREFDHVSRARAEDMVEWAEALGAVLSVDLKTAQLRRFLGAVLEVETAARKTPPAEFTNRETVYLRVYLAYAAGRNQEVRPVLDVLGPMVERVRPAGEEGWQDFRELVRFVRAVVAYHKFYGGND